MSLNTDTKINVVTALSVLSANKKIPKVIERQVLTALSHYPELGDACIRFIFTQQLKRSVMAARPVIRTLFYARKRRVYDILISPVFKLKHSIEPIHQVADAVLIGWIGHELGHIMDYEERSTIGIARFGLLYWLSKRYVRKAERVADTFAVTRGMGSYILATKEFILDHSELSQRYKDKIARLYLSPDDIVELVAKLEEKTQDDREEILAEESQIVEDITKEDQ
ncbi:hypothetical protein [Sphingobacterium pedocola]|uniref:Peptidase M48 domain-containing protein n=1 Tax=Sphingobacterium pedocola TaxID=2082722 RepID=A0ABR9T4Z8_9SPHI|nr:hypothetical protein [Sphingobacterium pedocola]MBE8720355.1 hypothetical protein [Sphingobacterium pedocola]